MTTAPTEKEKSIARQMADMARERGSQTNDDLIAAGFTTDEIQRCSPLAAKMLRDTNTAIAA